MHFDHNSLLLYAVTDRTWLCGHTLLSQVEAAIQGGITCVQLREKELDEQTFLQEALTLRQCCQRHQIPFIVNDNVAVALACGADGVHVGQEDMQAGNVRAMVGAHRVLGVSVQTVEQARLAQQNGANYLGVGAMFATATKPNAGVVSLDALTAICQAVTIPVVAIGGIDRQNLSLLSKTGIQGVALISGIFGANNIEAASRELRTLAEQVVSR